jgi:transaldolase
MIAVECLRGVTANPSIFEKAILGSTDYDEDLDAMAPEGLDAAEIYERIAIRDVQLAADGLADVHRRSNGHDGFVSLAVRPEPADDVEATGRGALVLAADQPPERDDRDPGNGQGDPGR